MKTSTTKSILAVATLLTFTLFNPPSMAAEGIVSVDTGEYGPDLVLMPGATTSSQDPDDGCIASGETKSGTIFPAGDTDPNTFYGEAGQRVLIVMADNSGALYPRLQLYDPNGVRVSEAGDSWVFHYGIVRIENHQLKATGIYTIVASDIGLSTGEYELSLLLVPGATTSPQDPNGGDIASGETKSGSISPVGDMDAYAFYGQTGEGVVIQMADIPSKGDLYPRLQLYEPNGIRVNEAGDSWVFHYGIVRIENYQLKKTGIYTIVASDIGLSKGEYGLSLLLMPPKNPYGLYPYDPLPADGNSISYCDPNNQIFDIVIENMILPDGSVVERLSGGNFLSWWSVIGATGYDVYFANGPCMPLEKIAENIADPWVAMRALEGNNVYYWQVVAHTPAGDIKGPVWWFETGPCPPPPPPCSLTLSVIGRGSITDPNLGAHSYSCGEVVPVTAVADPNYEFVRWEGTAVDANKVEDEYQDPTGSKISVTVDGAYTLKAVFEEVLFDFPLDIDPGWTRDGQWEFGMPKGQGGDEHGNPDPTAGHTGQNVFGVNLNGDYDARIGGSYCLVAGPFDLRGYRSVHLRFWSWLNTDWSDYVKNSLEMSLDGRTWLLVLHNPEQEDVADDAWSRWECGIGSWADDQPAVYLRWSYQVLTERAYPYSGWNLDDIQLIGRK